MPTRIKAMLTLLFYLLIGGHLIAQSITADTSLAARHYATADSLYEVRAYDSARHYYQSASVLFERPGICDGMIKAQSGLGLTISLLGDHKTGVKVLREALQAVPCCASEKTMLMALVNQDLGKSYNTQRQYDSALYYQHKALEGFIDYYGRQHLITASALSSLGTIYFRLEEYEKARHAYQEALTIRIKQLGKNHLKTGYLHTNMGKNYLNWGKYKRARIHYQKALAIKKAQLDEYHPFVADAYNDLGAVYDLLGNYDLALDHYQKALSIRTRVYGEYNPSVANTFVNLGLLYYQTGNYEKAVSNLLKSLEIHHCQPNRNDLLIARIQGYAGVIFEVLGQFDCSLEYQQLALNILKNQKGTSTQVITAAHNNLGGTLMALGRYDQALEHYQLALSTLRGKYGEGHIDMADFYFNIGIIFIKTEQHDLANIHFQKALNIRLEILGDLHPDVGNCYDALASVFKEEKKYDQAFDYYQKALKISLFQLGEKHTETADLYSNIGLTYQAKNQNDQALTYYQKALDIRRSIYEKDHPKLASSYNQVGMIYESSGIPDQALAYYQLAIEQAERVFKNSHPDLAEYHNNVAGVYLKTGLYAKALEEYQKAIISNFPDSASVFSPTIPPLKNYLNGHILLSSLLGEAKALTHLNNHITHEGLSRILSIYRHCDKLIDQLRRSAYLENDKVRLGSMATKVYAQAIDVCIRPGKNYQVVNDPLFELAFYFSEKNKAMVLNSSLKERSAQQYAHIPAELLASENALKKQQTILSQKLSQHVTNELRKSYQEQLQQSYADHQQIINYLEKTYPVYHQLKYRNDTTSIKILQDNLEPESAIIEYLLTESSILIFTIHQQGFDVNRFALPHDFDRTLQQLVKQLSTHPADKNMDTDLFSYANNAGKLYSWLMGKALSQLPTSVKNLIIIPDGPLNHLNFGALTPPISANADQQPDFSRLHYLIRDYDISYAISANLWMEAKQRDNKKRPYAPMAFGGFAPEYNTQLSNTDQLPDMVAQLVRAGEMPLPGAKEEVKQIAELMDGDAWTGDQASESHFRKKAYQYNVLHLAMHALLDDQEPSNSCFVFSTSHDTLTDGYLHASEIYGIPLHARLSVLSACNSGAGQIKEGEGIMSLSRAFMYAGCPAQIISLWKVSDFSSKNIMIDFYSALNEGHPFDAALRKAQLKYLNEIGHPQYSHPFYWASFIPIGRMDTISFDSGLNIWEKTFIISIIMGLLAILVLRLTHKSKFIKWKPTPND